MKLFKLLSRFFPGLQDQLSQAGLVQKSEEYLRKAVVFSSFFSISITLTLAFILIRFEISPAFLILMFPALLVLLFFNFVKQPALKIRKKQREFDQDIVFAGKFLVLELQSGVPVYSAMISVAKTYPVVGKYFREILNKIDIGTPMEVAINETIELTPSNTFRKLLWQIYNSLKTGSDLASAMSTTVEQIAADQIIQVKEYGKKLNPLVMFYMVVAVIFPSIGIIMFIVFSSFLSINVNLIVLLSVAFFVSLIQLMFLAVIRGQRPAVAIQ